MDAFTLLILIAITWIIVGVSASGGHTSNHTEYDPNGWVSLKDIIKDIDSKPEQTVTDENVQGYQYNGLL